MLRILLVASLLTAGAIGVMPTALGDTVVFSATGAADSVWALRMEADEPGSLILTIQGSGVVSNRYGVGFAVLDASGAERQTSYGMGYFGDEGVLLASDINGVPNVAFSTGPERTCVWCTTTDYLGHPAGTFYVVGWGAGFEQNSFEVVSRIDPVARVLAVAHGTALAASNEDFEGQLSAHAAQTAPTGHDAAANALLDAAITHAATGRMFGFFLSYDPKVIDITPRAYVGDVGAGVPFGASISKDSLIDPLSDAMCRGLIGIGCATREISWDGPGAAGGEGSFFYRWTSTPPGDYSFDAARQLSASTNTHIGDTSQHPTVFPPEVPRVSGPVDTNLYEARLILMYADVELP